MKFYLLLFFKNTVATLLFDSQIELILFRKKKINEKIKRSTGLNDNEVCDDRF